MRIVVLVVLLVACGDNTSAGQITAHELARACIGVTACGLNKYATSFDAGVGKCLADEVIVSRYRPGQVRCIAAAGADCNAVSACVGLWVQPGCSRADVDSWCDGDFLKKCHNGIESAELCNGGLDNEAGYTCLVGSEGPACGASCAEPGVSSCDGARAYYCSYDRILTWHDCSSDGRRCVSSTSCEYESGERCPQNERRCDGNDALICDGPNRDAVRVDCASQLHGGTCVDSHPETTGVEPSCGFDDECDTYATASTCAGDVLSACVLGKKVELDCRELGFARCAVDRCTI